MISDSQLVQFQPKLDFTLTESTSKNSEKGCSTILMAIQVSPESNPLLRLLLQET